MQRTLAAPVVVYGPTICYDGAQLARRVAAACGADDCRQALVIVAAAAAVVRLIHGTDGQAVPEALRSSGAHFEYQADRDLGRVLAQLGVQHHHLVLALQASTDLDAGLEPLQQGRLSTLNRARVIRACYECELMGKIDE